MNKKQKAVIISAGVIIFASVLFPPWDIETKNSRDSIPPGDYSIFHPPSDKVDEYHDYEVSGHISFERLFLEWVLIGIVAGGGFWVFTGKQ